MTYTVTSEDRTADLEAGQVLIYMPGLDTSNPQTAVMLNQFAGRLQATLMRSGLILDGVTLPTPPLPTPLVLLERVDG